MNVRVFLVLCAALSIVPRNIYATPSEAYDLRAERPGDSSPNAANHPLISDAVLRQLVFTAQSPQYAEFTPDNPYYATPKIRFSFI